MIRPAPTRVMLALMLVHQTKGRATVAEVAYVAERSRSTVYVHLRGLRDAGLVAWEPGRKGTLRPLLQGTGTWGRTWKIA